MSISQSSDLPLLAGSRITIDTIKKPTRVSLRRTKVVCTLGPACWEVEQLEKLIDAGMGIARFNFSHGDHDGHKACLDRLRQAAKNKDSHIGEYRGDSGGSLMKEVFENMSWRLHRVSHPVYLSYSTVFAIFCPIHFNSCNA